eukprot:COSAG02_NODE_552_length_20429_cov_28.014068_6_plen_74_part_00
MHAEYGIFVYTIWPLFPAAPPGAQPIARTRVAGFVLKFRSRVVRVATDARAALKATSIAGYKPVRADPNHRDR